MELLKMFSTVLMLWMGIFALMYGIIHQSTFYVSVAIYCKLSSSIAAYELGWLKPGNLSCTKVNDERNRNEKASTGVQ